MNPLLIITNLQVYLDIPNLKAICWDFLGFMHHIHGGINLRKHAIIRSCHELLSKIKESSNNLLDSWNFVHRLFACPTHSVVVNQQFPKQNTSGSNPHQRQDQRTFRTCFWNSKNSSLGRRIEFRIEEEEKREKFNS